MDLETFKKHEYCFKKDSVNDTYNKSIEYFFEQKWHDKQREQTYAFDLLSDLMLGSNVYSMLSGLGFSINEAGCELSNSLNLTFEGYYRYAYLALRNCLELVIIANYFIKLQPDSSLDNTNNLEEWFERDKTNQKYKDWLKSDAFTPNFSKMLDELSKLEYFEQFNSKYELKERLKNLYWQLSDIIHIKGKSKSSSAYEGKHCYNSTRNNVFLKERFEEYWSIRQNVVDCAVIVTLLQFPIGLVGFEIEQKFGINGPVGFLESHNSNLLRNALRDDELAFLDKITKDDGWIIGAKEFVDSRPDITEEEYKQQLKEWKNDFNINL